jgi:uncharacterized coiled-coil protein SlyX
MSPPPDGRPAKVPRPTVRRTGRTLLLVSVGFTLAACPPTSPNTTATPAADSASARASSEATKGLEQRVAQLEMRLLEKDAEMEELQGRLDDARQEVVRAMAKIQTLATRAEAASAMAEAEIAVQALKTAAGPEPGPDAAQATRLLETSTAAFNKANYGGAVYLANQAKALAAEGQARLASGLKGAPRPGEVLFALPLRLEALGKANVRDGPGTAFKVSFTLDAGAAVTGSSYVDEWIRITDEGGRRGWVFRTLVGRHQQATQ